MHDPWALLTACARPLRSPAGGSWDGRPYEDLGSPVDALLSVRGSSSSRNAKKSWNAKFRSGPGPRAAKLAVPLLGMPADDSWALYGPEDDRSLGMRNMLVRRGGGGPD